MASLPLMCGGDGGIDTIPFVVNIITGKRMIKIYS